MRIFSIKTTFFFFFLQYYKRSSVRRVTQNRIVTVLLRLKRSALYWCIISLPRLSVAIIITKTKHRTIGTRIHRVYTILMPIPRRIITYHDKLFINNGLTS